MDRVQFKINGQLYTVGCDVDSEVTLLDFIRRRAHLLGTKYMCLEGGCGACIVSVIKYPGAKAAAINACLVLVPSCHNWEITTIDHLGNKLDGYHPIIRTLAKFNGTQCGHCSPGWVMSMYSLCQSASDLTMHDIEKSLGSNICRCTGYRSILDAFKTFGKDSPRYKYIDDIEDLHLCNKNGSICNKDKCQNTNDDDWCVVTEFDIEYPIVREIVLQDGKYWYGPHSIRDIFNVLDKKGTADSYMLVAGNTAKGVYPIDEYPRNLIDISEVKELKGYKVDQNLIIGSGTTLTELLDIFKNMSVNESSFGYLKTLHEHLKMVAHIAVRNLGTIGGNLMLKHQHNEFASDIYLLLSIIDARVTILSRPYVKRVLTMEEFLKLNMIGKIILNVLLPPLNDDHKIVTYKIMPRNESSKAIVNAAFLYKYKCHDYKVLLCRISYGGLSPLFTGAIATAKYMVGKILFTNETLQSALKILETELVVEENILLASVAYRKHLALALLYKSFLSLSPTDNIDRRVRSGTTQLNISRPLSKGQQTYNTNPSLYPITQPIPRLEALIQCSGEPTYTEDHPIYPREVFAALVLSTVPTGAIESIDPSEALKQGAIAFYSAKDLPGLNSFTPTSDALTATNEEVFCSGIIGYYNQPIGVIVGNTKKNAEKFAKMVKVKYCNVKKPVTDVKEAKKDPNRNSIFKKIDRTDKGDNIAKTLSGCFTSRGQIHLTMETIVCISRPTEEGIEIYPTSQWIDGVQESVSNALNIPGNRVDVYVRRVGGGFGLKISRTNLAAVASSLVTLKLNRPCRMIMPLTDITRAFGKRFPCSSEYDVAIDSKGVIQYLNLNLYEDNGFVKNEMLQALAVDNFSNCYNGSRWNYKNISTLTDTAKNTWFRAPGHFENVAATEAVMERISYEMGLDPIEVRLKNLDKNTEADVISMVATIMKSSEYNKRKNEVLKFNNENRWKKRGIGTSFLRWKNDYPRNFHVVLAVFHGDGSIIITHSGIEIGQGINTKAAQICAYLLGVPLSKIQIKGNSSISIANVATTGGSLTTQNISIGVHKCCLKLLEILQPVRKTLNNPTWEELIHKAYEMNVDLQVNGPVGPADNVVFYVFGVTIAEVEIDVLTGERQVLRVDILEDVGQSPSPLIDIGQIEGAFVQGMGFWLSENLIYDPDCGELLTNRTWNYHVPLATDIPQDFRVSFRQNSYSSHSIFGSKHTSEPPICMSVAVPHAIRHALTSARLDNGIPTTSWFDLDGTHTLDKVCLAAATKCSDFKL